MPDTSVGFVVTGGGAWRLTVDESGEVGSVVAGPVAEGDTDLLFTMPPDDATAVVVDGTLGLDEAFMRGRTKLIGSAGRFMDVLPAFAGDEWRAACRPLVAPEA